MPLPSWDADKAEIVPKTAWRRPASYTALAVAVTLSSGLLNWAVPLRPCGTSWWKEPRTGSVLVGFGFYTVFQPGDRQRAAFWLFFCKWLLLYLSFPVFVRIRDGQLKTPAIMVAHRQLRYMVAAGYWGARVKETAVSAVGNRTGRLGVDLQLKKPF